MPASDQPPFYAPDTGMIVKPLNGDCLARKPVLDRLTRLAERLPKGGVIGVDGRWGEGKTWVARHWLASLPTQAPTAYLNAFEQDFEDDAFASIARAILEAAQGEHGEADGKWKPVRQALMNVSVAFATKGARAVANLVTGGASGPLLDAVADIGAEAVRAGAETGATMLNDALQAAEKRRRSLDGLRAAIDAFTRENAHPLVVAVDELDRCRPEFALQMLDRLKHLFDLPRVVFVLFVNRAQLEASVGMRYGQPTAAGYLDKFVHFWISLAHDPGSRRSLAVMHRELMNGFFSRLGADQQNTLTEVSKEFSALSSALDLCARDVERAACLAVSVDETVFDRYPPLGAWLLALRVARPEIFRGLLVDNPGSHRLAGELARIALERMPHAGRTLEEFTKVVNLHDLLAKSERMPFPQQDLGWFNSPDQAGLQVADLARRLNA